MLQLDFRLCGECGGCVAVCPFGALELLSSGLKIKNNLCSLCENCVIFCPTGALRIKPMEGKTSFPSQTKIFDPKNE
ncbi:MAG: 4Fe-4S binding protein [candidate division Zixibacteria bacterium]|nr:4Fe-4S binding protein [candidate division Zixibacteria bacterium]